jgi:hypothetical protein
MPTEWGALQTVTDYEEAALAASQAVRAVRVRARANDPSMPAGKVEVTVRGWGWWIFRRELSAAERGKVRAALAARSPVGVALVVK